MRSTITAPCRSCQNAGIDAKAAPAPLSLPSRSYSPRKKDNHGGESAIPPSVPSIALAAVNAANAAAVAATNPWRSIKFPLVLIADISEPVSSTLPAGVATFPVADIMPTEVVAPTAKFARPEVVVAVVSVPTAAAYSTLGVTTAVRAEAATADVTVTTAASAYLSTAEAAAADLPVPVNTGALSSAGMAIAEAAAAAADLPVPVNTGALSSSGMAIAEAVAADVTFKTAASANLATAEAAVADVRGECVGLILHQFIYDMN
jgi:hypothetical protein